MFTRMLLDFAVNRLPGYQKWLVLWAVFCIFYIVRFDHSLSDSSLVGLWFSLIR